MKSRQFGFFIVFVFSAHGIDGNCVLPSDLQGTWNSAHKGDLYFTNTSIVEYRVALSATINNATFVCDHYYQQNIVFKSEESFTIFSQQWIAYLCLSFTKINDNVYYYTINTALDESTVQYVAVYQTTDNVSDEAICNKIHAETTAEFVMLIKNGSEVSEIQATCPDNILRTFGNTVILSNDRSSNCSGFETNVCNDSSIMSFNDQSCPPSLRTSPDGILICLHSVASANATYVAMWVSNSTSSTDRILCYAFTETTETTYATTVAGMCGENQTAYSVPPPGLYVKLSNMTRYCGKTTTTESLTTALYLVTSEESRDEIDQSSVNISSIIGVSLGGAILLLAAAILVFVCSRCCREKKSKTFDTTGEKTDIVASDNLESFPNESLGRQEFEESETSLKKKTRKLKPDIKNGNVKPITTSIEGISCVSENRKSESSVDGLNEEHTGKPRTSTAVLKVDAICALNKVESSSTNKLSESCVRKRNILDYSLSDSDDISIKQDLVNDVPDFDSFVNDLTVVKRKYFQTFAPFCINIRELSMGAEQSNEQITQENFKQDQNARDDVDGSRSEKENEVNDIEIMPLDDNEPMDAEVDTSGVGTSLYTDASVSLDYVDSSRTGYNSELEGYARVMATPDNDGYRSDNSVFASGAINNNHHHQQQRQEVAKAEETVEPKYYIEANLGVTPRPQSLETDNNDSPRKSLNVASYRVEVSRSVQTDRISPVTKHFRYEPGLRIIKPRPSYLRNGNLLNEDLLRKLKGNMDKSIMDLQRQQRQNRENNFMISGRDMAKYNPNIIDYVEDNTSFATNLIRHSDSDTEDHGTNVKQSRVSRRRLTMNALRPFRTYSPIPEERSFHSGIESSVPDPPAVISGFEMSRYNPPGIFSTAPKKKIKKNPNLFQDTMVGSDFVWCSGTVYREYKPSFHTNDQKRRTSFNNSNPMSWRSPFRVAVPWR